MKLNLVADFCVGGKRFATTFAIHESNNLVDLREMCAQGVYTKGEWVKVYPDSLLMCASAKRAEEVAAEWERGYRAEGSLFGFGIEIAESKKESGVAE